MHFDLVDAVVSMDDASITTLKAVPQAEEYLQDHFPSFPVLPGVMMIEALTQAARRWLDEHGDADTRYTLAGVKALKYGMFVKPGETMRVTVTVRKRHEDGRTDFIGNAVILRPGTEESDVDTCVSGRFTMRPLSFD